MSKEHGQTPVTEESVAKATQALAEGAPKELAKAGASQAPTIGRIVHYRLSADDAEQANRRRKPHAARDHQPGGDLWPTQAQAHVGNEAREGTYVPMLIVATWGGTTVNGQAFLDGNDVLWVTSRQEGTAPGTWTWPPRS